MDRDEMKEKEIKGEKVNRKKKENKKREKRKREKERLLWTFHLFIYVTQPGEAVLPNVFLKRIQLPHRIRFTSTATAGAGALPNAPSV
jgi:hypothetical protein